MTRQMIGKVFGPYLIEKELAPGGMSRVYVAVRLTDELRVALKILPGQLAMDPGFLERFKREAEGIQRLNHPNIVCMISAGEDEGLHYYAMEYIKGESLRELLNRRRRLPYLEALDITITVANALRYAHSQGIIHRDVKPENIMLDESGLVKLTDFGIAKFVGATQMTSTGDIIGTPEYMSPEQAAGRTNLDARSDIFSLGVVLYEMATGRKPFRGGSTGAILKDIQLTIHESAKEFDPAIPASLNHVINKMLEKQPAQRYRDAEKLLRRLEMVWSAIGKVADAPGRRSVLEDTERKPRETARPVPERPHVDQDIYRLPERLRRLGAWALASWKWLSAAAVGLLALTIFLLWLTGNPVWDDEYRKLWREYRSARQMEIEATDRKDKYLEADEAYKVLRGKSQHFSFANKADERIKLLEQEHWPAIKGALERRKTRERVERLFAFKDEKVTLKFRGKPGEGRPQSEQASALPWFEQPDETGDREYARGISDEPSGTETTRKLSPEATSAYDSAGALAGPPEHPAPDDEPPRTAITLIERLADSCGEGLTILRTKESVHGDQIVVSIAGNTTDDLDEDRWEILAKFQVLLEESFDNVEVHGLENEPGALWFKFSVKTGAEETAEAESTLGSGQGQR